MTTMTAIRPRVVGVEDAAAYMSVPVRFIRRLVAEKRIRYRKVGKYVRFDIADLDAFLDEGLCEAVRRG
ncbi:helix-turn-helix domain-containing protein [Glycomyces artemisiae]|uniref:Excisionase family DNA binding protein n=1 Tax=Glycomyces artemisiae TaxID=1076443 RepID=A0A2T0UHZ2_9ACTN|nr:helix-turn-helix domain-containing protein [Glycomyces artemisiae]PRY57488.1 excisionase family DNA binding protein [Glycomyces artemisiae]